MSNYSSNGFVLTKEIAEILHIARKKGNKHEQKENEGQRKDYDPNIHHRLRMDFVLKLWPTVLATVVHTHSFPLESAEALIILFYQQIKRFR